MEHNVQHQLQGLNLYLIGMMGAGKTTIAQVLARHLNYQFFDTDAIIEQLTHQSIAELFATLGEAGFRDLETRVLSELAPYTRLAIATGGGIVTRRENWSYLRHGLIIWLDVPLECLQTRLQHDTTRPLLSAADLTTRLPALLAQRRSLYAQADLQIELTGQEPPAQIASHILERIPTVLKTPAQPPNNGNGTGS